MIFRRFLSAGKEKMATPDTASEKPEESKPTEVKAEVPPTKSEEKEPKSEEVKVAEEKKPVEEELGKAEEVKVEEEKPMAEAAPAKEASKPSIEATSLPSFKEESYHVQDLKESEKKALAEFSDKVEAAIKANEFVLPPPVVETVKATAVAQGNEEATVVVATVETEVKEGDVVVDKAEDTAVAVVTREGISVVPVELSEEAPKVEEAAPSETPKEESAPVVTPKEESAPVVTPKEEAAPSETAEAPAEVPKEVAAPAEAEASPSEAPKEESAPTGAPKEESAPTEAPKEEGAIEEAAKEPAPEAKTEEVAATTEVAPEAPAVEEKEKEAAPPADLDLELWGIPLLPSKGDPRTQVVFLKFLRARDFKVKEAFTMLKNAILWRKKYGADKLVEEDLGSEFGGTAFNHGVDKEGHPVQYNVFGSLEGKALGEDALRWRIQLLEKEIRKLSFSPGGVSSLLQVFDLKNAPLLSNKALRQFLSQAIMCMLDNYPELVVKIVFLNTPWYYSALYTFVSPFLTQRTKSKLVFGSSLFKYISPDNIPVQYGGLGRVNDTEFGEGNVPVSELAIKAGERQIIDIEVTAAGATVVWDVAIVGGEVTYGAEFAPKKEGGYTTVVEKPKKVTVLEEPIRNTFKATEPGKLVLTIDNSSSRKKKNAVYRYVVKAPAAVAEE